MLIILLKNMMYVQVKVEILLYVVCPVVTSRRTIIAREVEQNDDLLIAVQPTRGLDVGAIEFIHKQIVKTRDNNKAVLLVSLELDEVMNLSDRILVMYEGEIVADLNPKRDYYSGIRTLYGRF